MPKMDRTELFDDDPVRVFLLKWINAHPDWDMKRLSEKLGRSHSYIQQFLKRGVPRKLDEDTRENLAGILGVSEDKLGARSKRRPTDSEIHVDNVTNRRIFEYNALSSAGGGIVLEDEDKVGEWLLPKRYLEDELGNGSGKLAILPIRGDSMEPTLRSGDRILIDQGDINISQPGVFVLWDGDGRVVKRVERLYGSEPIRLRLISDNPLHSTYDVPVEDVTIIGRVIMAARRI